MRIGDQEILVVGDRILVRLDTPDDRTSVGLYLPQTVVEKEKVASGTIVATGPGTPMLPPESEQDAHWKEGAEEPRYVPMQARVGDHALFVKNSAIEIKFKDEMYQVVPQAAILVLIRDVSKPEDWTELEF